MVQSTAQDSGSVNVPDCRGVLEVLYSRDPPLSQQAICDLAAEVAALVLGSADEDLLESCARGLASGLFGKAYDTAGPDQRRRWNKMCEASLRGAWQRIDDRTNGRTN